MKFKVIDVEEIGTQLRVTVETEFGVKNIGMSANKKYKDPFTGKPQWLTEVKEQMKKLYPVDEKEGIVKKVKLNDKHINTEIDTDE
jgi:hypothetical protein